MFSSHLYSALLCLLLASPLSIYALDPEIPLDITPIYSSYLSERFLQDNSTLECPSGYRCTLTMNVSETESVIVNNDSLLQNRIFLTNQPQADLRISYSSTSNDTDIQTAIILTDFQQPQTRRDPPQQQASWEMVIPKSLIKQYRNGAVYVLTLNQSPEPITVTMRAIFDNSSVSTIIVTPNENEQTSGVSSSTGSISFLNILLPVAGSLVFLLILSMWCYYYRKRQHQRLMGRTMRRLRRSRDQPEQEEDGLTEENINERFPEAKYEEFQSSFVQTICSICLEEFKKDASCRQLYCEHLFHAECVRLWLVAGLQKGHASCPNCNRNMIKKNPQSEDIELQVEE